MPRGGKRKGAGVKSNIGKIDRELIGEAYDEEAFAIAEAVVQRKRKAILALKEIEESRARLNELPPGKARKAVSKDTHEDLEWLHEELDGDQKDTVSKPRRQYRRVIPFKTPQGVRNSILKKVATEASRRLGFTVTPRQVRRCRDEVHARRKNHL